MSIVKMDMEEYKALMKVQEILEKSLKTEAVLREELADAQEEKIQAMKSAEKTVTIIEQVENTEHITFLRPAEDIYGMLKNMFKSGRIDPYFNKMNMVEDGYKYRDHWHQIADAFFGSTKSTSMSDKLVIRKGFDEVISEIKKEVKNDFTSTHRIRLENLERTAEEYDKLKKESKADAMLLKQLKADKKSLELQLESRDKDYEKLDRWYDDVNDKLAKINTTVNSGNWTLWKSSKDISKIKEIVRS